ncbi:MAG: HAD family phosphatase [Bacteroidetes bacterium]|nr:HAD family phosphatase [Bacteroidota bacterium]
MNLLSGIRNIIFDFGGVIIDLDFEKSYRAFSDLRVPGFEVISNMMLNGDLILRFEKGFVSPAEFRNELRKLAGRDITDKEIDGAWNSLLLDIPSERIRLLEKLRISYRLFLLCNSNRIHYEYYTAELKRMHGYNDFSELFENDYFSFNLGLYKPDTAIYKIVLEENRLIPGETLFIDDSLPNIEAAGKLGLRVCHLRKKTVNQIFAEHGVSVK